MVGNVCADHELYRQHMRKLGYAEVITRRITESYDENLVKYSVWALSNLCRGSLTHKSQKESLAAFIKGVLVYNDPELLENCIQSISELMNKEMVDSFIEAGLIKRLAEISREINSLSPLI